MYGGECHSKSLTSWLRRKGIDARPTVPYCRSWRNSELQREKKGSRRGEGHEGGPLSGKLIFSGMRRLNFQLGK